MAQPASPRTSPRIAPLIAGLDKFANLLTQWDLYLSPMVPEPAIGVQVRPRIFAYVVAACLAGVILNLLAVGGYSDVALRDFGLMLGAFALGRLAQVFDRSLTPRVDKAMQQAGFSRRLTEWGVRNNESVRGI